jgi:hypothetical protein
MKFILYFVKFNHPIFKLPERDLIVLSPELLFTPKNIFLSGEGTTIILYSLIYFGETVKVYFFNLLGFG